MQLTNHSRNIISFIVIFSLSFISYFNTFESSFHFDDFLYIINNEAFKEYIEHPFSVRQTLSTLSDRSIVLDTLYLNYSLGGFNVFGFHLVNLTIHVATSFLVFLFFKEVISINRYLKTQNTFQIKANIPLIAALIFSVHPMNTQAVTYITGRSSLLATCFYLTAFLFFVKGIKQNLPAYVISDGSFSVSVSIRKILCFITSSVFLVAGYGSKFIIMTAPIMFIIYYSFFTPANLLKRFFDSKFAGISIRTIVILSPFILIFFSKYIDIQAISTTDSGLLSKMFQPIHVKLYHLFSFTKNVISSPIYLLTEFKAVVFYYIKMAVFPFNQNIDPDFPVAHGMLDTGVMFSIGIIILCLFSGINQKKNRIIAFGIFWFFITLLPTSSILPLLDTVSEHRMYLPLIGISAIFPLLLSQFVSISKKSPFNKLIYFIFFVFIPIILFTALTAKRNFVWQDEKSLWLDAAEKSPGIARPFNNLGEAYDKNKDYERAIETLNKAISISPNYYKPYNNLGKIYGKLGKLDLASENLKIALKNKPFYPIGHYNLGKVYELKGMLDPAVEEYSIAIKQKYDFFEACFNLANVFDKKGEYPKALETYMNCRKFKSSHPKTLFAIGSIYIKTGKIDEAFKYYSRVVELDNSYYPAKIAIGNIFAMKGNFTEAVNIYRQVIKSDPKNFNVHNNLGMIFFQQLNNPSQAVRHFKKSLKINPDQQNANMLRELIEKNNDK